jgi:hypothetical protein
VLIWPDDDDYIDSPPDPLSPGERLAVWFLTALLMLVIAIALVGAIA